jgi:NitT/TauT family transport system permease protein
MDLAERSTPSVQAPAGMAVARLGPGALVRRRRGWRARWAALGGTTLTSVVVFLVAWEAIVDLLHIPRYIVPAPSAVARQFVLHFPLIWRYTLVTGGETLIGFVIAVTIGVPLAMLVAFSKFLERTLYPSAVTLEMVPKIAFAPLFVTWFGFGFLPKMIVVFMVCFFPILLNGILAFRSLSSELIHFSRSTGAGPWTMFWRIRVPAALPQIFVGLKGAATNATVGAVISEWIGGDAGLGYYLQIATGDLRTDLSFGIIMMLAALGLALFYLVTIAERRLVPWHVSQRIVAERI